MLTLAGGALLGWTGAVIIICAATIGSTIVFIAARTVLNEFFEKRTTGFIAKLKSGFQDNAFFYLLALRLILQSPFWVVNIVPALLGMRLKHYVLATLIGITPGTLIYVWFARSFDSLLSSGQIQTYPFSRNRQLSLLCWLLDCFVLFRSYGNGCECANRYLPL